MLNTPQPKPEPIMTWRYTDDHGTTWIGIYQPSDNTSIRDFSYCDKSNSHIDHKGWYADSLAENTYRGVIVHMHGKRTAVGYHDANSECICIDESSIEATRHGALWDDIAYVRANEADDTARYPAERAREDDEKQQVLFNISHEWEENEAERDVIADLFDCRHHNNSVAVILADKFASYKSTRVSLTKQAEDLDETIESILEQF